jgi:hypothetical protein
LILFPPRQQAAEGKLGWFSVRSELMVLTCPQPVYNSPFRAAGHLFSGIGDDGRHAVTVIKVRIPEQSDHDSWVIAITIPA